MLSYAITFFIISLIAALLGFGGVAGLSYQVGISSRSSPCSSSSSLSSPDADHPSLDATRRLWLPASRSTDRGDRGDRRAESSKWASGGRSSLFDAHDVDNLAQFRKLHSRVEVRFRRSRGGTLRAGGVADEQGHVEVRKAKASTRPFYSSQGCVPRAY